MSMSKPSVVTPWSRLKALQGVTTQIWAALISWGTQDGIPFSSLPRPAAGGNGERLQHFGHDAILLARGEVREHGKRQYL